MNTILLIDDDEGCRAPAAELLRMDQWNVIEAADGKEGLDLAMQHRPDVILCDLLMPRVNGYQVCRAVRDHVELRHTKVIVVTGRDYSSDRKSAEEAGAHGYLVKPLEISKLKAVLDQLSPSHANLAAAPPRASLGGCEHDDVRVKFWGVRGSIPSPGKGTVYYGGNTSCVEVRIGDCVIILDAGSGIRPLGISLTEERKGQPMDVTLLLTHTHWDHIQGFPFFAPAYDSRNRIHIYGYEGALSGVRAALSGQMESPYFPVSLDELPGNLRIAELDKMHFSVDGIQVEACFTIHPGVCVAYKLYTPQGTIVYMPDNETRIHNGNGSSSGIIPNSAEYHLRNFIEGVDLLMMDCQYTAEEYRSHVGWGHGCVDEVVRMAMSANVKRLYTFHHDPSHDDEFITAMLRHARQIAERAGSSMVVEAAQEGAEVRLQAAAPVAVA